MAKEKTTSASADAGPSKAPQPPQAPQQSSYVLNFLLFLSAIVIGMLIQQTQVLSILTGGNAALERPPSTQQLPTSTSIPPLKQQVESPIDMDALYREMSEKIKREVEASFKEKQEKLEKAKEEAKKPVVKAKEDEVVNEEQNKPVVKTKNKVVIDDSLKTDGQDLTINSGDKQQQQKIVIDPSKIKVVQETKEDAKAKERERQRREEAAKRLEEKEAKAAKAKQADKQVKVPDEVKNFKSSLVSKMKPKKMWIPIPNSNGGHRRCPAIEINAGKEHGSSVKVWLYEEFFSKEECEQLIQAHETHLKETLKQKPIVCFDSLDTLKKNLVELERDKFADLVTEADFTEGTTCLNQTFSRQLEKWGLKWSFSTAFYPGESKFAAIFGKRIHEATQLDESHGGKFQITSYPFDVGYKEHHDCILDNKDSRDRYATFLVYLNDLGADGGGETVFPELGIDVKPREGRALTWNSMNYETGACEPKSIHSASKVKHVTKKKYIIQRWYYYKNFYALGKRAAEPDIPARPANTPLVSCDNYDNGSCRLYDEWTPDHILAYRRAKDELF